MAQTPAHSLFLALERIFPRLQVAVKRGPAGLELSSETQILSEFLPSSLEFRRGYFGLPSSDLAAIVANWPTPYFVISLGDSPIPAVEGLQPAGCLVAWSKRPEPRKNPWSLKRVENVPDIESYRAFDPEDQLAMGAIDMFSEHFLALASPEQGAEIRGKVRVTNVDQGTFLLTRALAPSAHETPLIWQAVDDRLARTGASRLMLLMPEGVATPERYGFQPSLRLNLLVNR
jgi:hypothetical protein